MLVIHKVEQSKKTPLKSLLNIARNDVRSTTGSNLRKIMLLSGRNRIEDLKDVDIPYHAVPSDEAWRIGFVKEIVDQKQGELEVPGLLKKELDSILEYLCTQ